MDKEIKDYANSLYARSLLESSETFRQDQTAFFGRRGTAVGMSGAAVAGVIRLHLQHAERSMAARLDSYRQAYAAAVQIPSEVDLAEILRECEEVLALQLKHSEPHVVKFAGTLIAAETLKQQIAAGSGSGHDRVLQEWKVWRQETILKQKHRGSTQRQEKEKRMDAILPILDRSEFAPDLSDMITCSSAECPSALIVVDLDNLKLINDSTRSHHVGNKALQSIAEVLTHVSHRRGNAYRWGGDEFCVLLPNHTTDEGMAVAGRILREVQALRISELPAGITASIGVSCFPECVSDPTELFNSADAAMYKSKEGGRNRISKASARSDVPPTPQGGA